MTSTNTTESKVRCLTPAEIAETVRIACAEARKKAAEVPGLILQRDKNKADFNHCSGALSQWAGIDVQRVDYAQQLAVVTADRDSRVRRFWVVVGIGAGLVVGGFVGWGVGQF